MRTTHSDIRHSVDTPTVNSHTSSHTLPILKQTNLIHKQPSHTQPHHKHRDTGNRHTKQPHICNRARCSMTTNHPQTLLARIEGTREVPFLDITHYQHNKLPRSTKVTREASLSTVQGYGAVATAPVMPLNGWSIVSRASLDSFQ